MNRRKFIYSVAAISAASAIEPFAKSIKNISNKYERSNTIMAKFELPLLPYGYDALEPSIDKRTMEIHHDKHHSGYVSKLNAAVYRDEFPLFFYQWKVLKHHIHKVMEAIQILP